MGRGEEVGEVGWGGERGGEQGEERKEGKEKGVVREGTSFTCLVITCIVCE